jgi:hypothetical protein
MSDTEKIQWFKQQFKTQIENILQNTPFSVDMLTAIAMQETGYIWGGLRETQPLEEILKVCVGDTLDSPSRSAFPKNKADLLRATRGAEMFAIAREALEHVARYNASYRRVANSSANKFCHGFGIFQYDLQFFRTNPDFFLEKRWYNFDECLNVFVRDELKEALRRAYGSGKNTLTDREMAYVAIAYNAGSVNVRGSFKQGHKSDDGRYYGENIRDYMRLSQQVS